MHLVLLSSPRTLILVNGDHCLLFSSSEHSAIDVEFLPSSAVDLEKSTLLAQNLHGVLGLLSVLNQTYLAIITRSIEINSNSKESISRVIEVEFYCITSDSESTVNSYEVNAATQIGRNLLDNRDRENIEHPCAGVKRLLNNGSFYFSVSSGPEAGEAGAEKVGFDISRTLEKRLRLRDEAELERDEDIKEGDGDEAEEEEKDKRFLWNSFLVGPLLHYRKTLNAEQKVEFDRIVVLVIQGYVGVTQISGGAITLISRLNWKNYGTRFNSRGINDDGDVANFVETETIIRTSDYCCSFTQIRGSVPVFWEEKTQFGEIRITRPLEASLPAFIRHFQSILQDYSNIQIVNLLSSKPEERILTESYTSHLRASQMVDQSIRENVEMTDFDFHAKVKAGVELKDDFRSQCRRISDNFGSCMVSLEKGKETVVMRQRGVFRTNCKDCLDRTNVIQEFLSRFAMEDFLRSTGNDVASIAIAHRELFAENGDALSRIYTGTNAINSSFTRSGTKSLRGLFSDGLKSVGRAYQANFVDSSKQLGIDTLLGQNSSSCKARIFNPTNDAVRSLLKAQESSFSSYAPISIYVGTYNLNGRPPSAESLLPWLFPSSVESTILVISFQEIVPLNVQNIVATDPEQLKRWESHLIKTITERPNKKIDYIVLRSGQLVGTALLVLVDRALVDQFKNVEVTTIKTGLRGMSGNKGAVAIRLDFRATSLCFLTAHLAAGHTNITERHADYQTIATGLKFAKGRTLENHDAIIWAADTNYRINLSNEEVRSLVELDNFSTLADSDQLIQAMNSKSVFLGYSEGPLLFPPTYKYDLMTADYDTSPKQRIPAWTDRILFSGSLLDLNRYSRAEIYSSDHRPVYALFTATIKEIDYAKKSLTKKKILAEVLAGGGIEVEEVEDSELRGFMRAHELMRNLPLPSGENSNWYEGDASSNGVGNAELEAGVSTNPFE